MKNGNDEERDRLSNEVDYEKYVHFLEAADWSEDQKREYAQMIWNIIVDFVSLGFGVHPVQQARKDCISANKTPSNAVLFAQEMVEFQDNTLKEKYKRAADPEHGKAGKGDGP